MRRGVRVEAIEVLGRGDLGTLGLTPRLRMRDDPLRSLCGEVDVVRPRNEFSWDTSLSHVGLLTKLIGSPNNII